MRGEGVHEDVVIERRRRHHDHVGAGRRRGVVGDAGKGGEAGRAGGRLRVGGALHAGEGRQLEERDLEPLERVVGGDREPGGAGSAHRQARLLVHASSSLPTPSTSRQ